MLDFSAIVTVLALMVLFSPVLWWWYLRFWCGWLRPGLVADVRIYNEAPAGARGNLPLLRLDLTLINGGGRAVHVVDLLAIAQRHRFSFDAQRRMAFVAVVEEPPVHLDWSHCVASDGGAESLAPRRTLVVPPTGRVGPLTVVFAARDVFAVQPWEPSQAYYVRVAAVTTAGRRLPVVAAIKALSPAEPVSRTDRAERRAWPADRRAAVVPVAASRPVR
jgi:hypothetical protein